MTSYLVRFATATLIVAFAPFPAPTQDLPATAPSREQLANNNKLFIELATKHLHWDEPTEPVKIVGPLYFVGTRGLGSWLFATSEGLIPLNTGTAKSGPMIADSIRKLGFQPENTKIILNGHGHSDHAGAFVYIRTMPARSFT